MRARLRRWAAALLTAACVSPSPACTTDISDLASFIGGPFGDVAAAVTRLDEGQVETLMTDLMLRFRLYLTLRDAMPFGEIAPQACLTDVRSFGGGFSFVADVACTWNQVQPASGSVSIRQEQLADQPVVTGLNVEYRAVRLGALDVDGTEDIVETQTEDGASVRTLDLVQDGIELDYEFRVGLIDGETPVFDYKLKTSDGPVGARVTNPQSPGGFVTVILTGIDGALLCEVRDAAWEPGAAARGHCDNGVVFGLPD